MLVQPLVYMVVVLLYGGAVFWTFRYLCRRHSPDKHLAQVSTLIGSALVIVSLIAGARQKPFSEINLATASHLTANQARNLRQVGAYLASHCPQTHILLLVGENGTPDAAATLEAALKEDLPPAATIHTESLDAWLSTPPGESLTEWSPETGCFSQLDSVFDMLVATHPADVIVDTTTLLSKCRISASGAWQLPEAERPKLIIATELFPDQVVQMISEGWVTACIWDPQNGNNWTGASGTSLEHGLQMIDASTVGQLAANSP